MWGNNAILNPNIPSPSHHVNVSDEMCRRIVEAVPEGIWVVDADGRTIFGNRRMAEILGVDFALMPEQTFALFTQLLAADDVRQGAPQQKHRPFPG